MCDAFGPPLFPRPFQQYEVRRSRSFTYVYGVDKVLREFSVLRIPRKEEPLAQLELLDGEERWPLTQMEEHKQKAEAQSQGQSRDSSHLREVVKASGLVGFIRFLQGPYLILIKKHKKVGKIGHHSVLSIEATQLVELFAESAKSLHSREEKAFVDQFRTLHLSKDFYFSYSYELSRSAQQNLVDAKRARVHEDRRRPFLLETDPEQHHRFVWNHYHMSPFFRREGWQHWCLSIVHGFFAYTKCSSFGWTFEVVLIARRSRFHAGTRYRKRGLNVSGQVANDVETEQLLCDDSTRHLAHGRVMSFVQVRGSVPLFWSQEATTLNPKPPVVYPRCDPTLSATRLHFADLFERYGTPLLVVNLMKAKKLDSCEVRLSKHFESAIERLNRELPPSTRILYRPFDMKSQAKSSSGSVYYEVFMDLARKVVSRVGFFHSYRGLHDGPEKLQSGVVRTNCMDCLDRTNVLQFFVGLEVLQQQLTALNLLPEPQLEFDSQVVFVLQELYDLMGDHLALQYAGSVAHKKNPLLGSRPRMMTSTKELLTSIHRHYNNSYRDNEKQAGMNFFLGVYQPNQHPRLRELDCDSWVHHRALRDDYAPGDWWEAPLRRHAESMELLRSPEPTSMTSSQSLGLAPLVHPYALETSSAWFRVVHSAWKFTWFEKLLSRLEATFVQINASSRRLSTLAPCRGGTRGSHSHSRRLPLELPESPLAAGSRKPHPVALQDSEVYRRYVSTPEAGLESLAGQQLGPELDLDLGLLPDPPPGLAPSPSLPMVRALLQEHIGRGVSRHIALATQLHAEKVSHSQAEREEMQHMREVSLMGDRTGQALVHRASLSAGQPGQRQRSQEPPSSSGWDGISRAAEKPKTECVALCSYCGEAFFLGDVDTTEVLSLGRGSKSQMCPRHQQRAQELGRFLHRGSLRVCPVPGSGPAPGGASLRLSGRPTVGLAPGPVMLSSPRPGERWPQEPRQLQQQLQRQSARLPGFRSPVPLPRSQPQAQPSAKMWASATTSAPPAQRRSASRSDAAIELSSPATARLPAFSVLESAQEPPGKGLLGATSGSSAPAAIDLEAEDTSERAAQPADARPPWQLWAYTFPHTVPPAAAQTDLGLPPWWLDGLLETTSATPDVAATPVGLRGKRNREPQAARRPLALLHAGAAGTVTAKLEKSQGSRSACSRDAACWKEKEREKEAAAPRMGRGQGRSIFKAEAVLQFLDEPAEPGIATA